MAMGSLSIDYVAGDPGSELADLCVRAGLCDSRAIAISCLGGHGRFHDRGVFMWTVVWTAFTLAKTREHAGSEGHAPPADLGGRLAELARRGDWIGDCMPGVEAYTTALAAHVASRSAKWVHHRSGE